MTQPNPSEPPAMTTAGLHAKVELRRAWFAAHPIAPIEDGGPAYESRRASFDRLFADIEADALHTASDVDALPVIWIAGEAYVNRTDLRAALRRNGR